MTGFTRFSTVLTLGILCCSMGYSQTQSEYFARDFCVKAREGKAQELAAHLRDIEAKLGKAEVDAGNMAMFTIAQAVTPSGKAATCDYHIVVGYNGFPPEPPSPEQTAATIKKAGLSLTSEALMAKRAELAELVGIDVWLFRERVGVAKKGGYARINYDKVQPGMGAEWVSMESNGWKQLAEAAVKEHGTAWRAASLIMPGGTSLPYNAMTVDIFPSWEALAKGLPAREIWNKVHPERDMSAHLSRLAEIRDRPRVDLVKLTEVITK